TGRRSRSAFEKQGAWHSVDLPGMSAEEVLPAVRPLPEIDVRRVTAGPVRDAFCSIGSVCFHVPLTWFCEVFDSDAVWKRFAAYVRYVGGGPLSSGAVWMGGGAAGGDKRPTRHRPPRGWNGATAVGQWRL